MSDQPTVFGVPTADVIQVLLADAQWWPVYDQSLVVTDAEVRFLTKGEVIVAGPRDLLIAVEVDAEPTDPTD
ncbi:hypothetical protein BA059_17220 [Mycolicibacterium sp. (ex Dasyatis americana)]|nr:hypothetical protein BA059_17220 [Mycolicibacterium sp. (ex Dasyatis americana)]